VAGDLLPIERLREVGDGRDGDLENALEPLQLSTATSWIT